MSSGHVCEWCGRYIQIFIAWDKETEMWMCDECYFFEDDDV